MIISASRWHTNLERTYVHKYSEKKYNFRKNAFVDFVTRGVFLKENSFQKVKSYPKKG